MPNEPCLYRNKDHPVLRREGEIGWLVDKHRHVNFPDWEHFCLGLALMQQTFSADRILGTMGQRRWNGDGRLTEEEYGPGRTLLELSTFKRAT